MERVKAEVLELAEGCNCFSSSKEAPWPLALKSCFKDESYTKRHFEFLLPQAQRSYVDLSCRLCWRRNYLNCTDLRDYMAGMRTMNMQPKYLWVFWLTLGLTLVSLLCISCSYLYWGSGWKICHYFISSFSLTLSNLNCFPNTSKPQTGSKHAFHSAASVWYEKGWKEGNRDWSRQLCYFCVCNSWKGKSVSDTLLSFRNSRQPFGSNLIADTFMSVWTFDCHQIAEEQLKQLEQTQHQYSSKSSSISVWSVLLRYFRPAPHINFSLKKEQYKWVSDSLGILVKWLPKAVTPIRNLTWRSCWKISLPLHWL